MLRKARHYHFMVLATGNGTSGQHSAWSMGALYGVPASPLRQYPSICLDRFAIGMISSVLLPHTTAIFPSAKRSILGVAFTHLQKLV
jgi:hypothetical protein